MKEEMKGIYWAVILSIAVIFVTNYFFPRKPATTPTTPEVPAVETVAEKVEQPLDDVTAETPLEVSEVLGKDARIKIKNAAVSGSLRIKGARFDEILLDKYKQTLETDSADVELFAPAKTAAPYYAEFGWLPAGHGRPHAERRHALERQRQRIDPADAGNAGMEQRTGTDLCPPHQLRRQLYVYH